MFDVGVPGLLITSKGNPATDYGSWSTICDLGVYGGDSLVYWQITDPHQPTSPVCGINMTRPGRLRNVYVENWKTDGIYIQSESSVSPRDAGLDDANGQQFFTEAAGGYGGTNGWTLENVITQSNGRDGLHVLGGNSNSGYCTNLISNANGRFGIFDQSQISDTYVGCLLELNVYGALRTVAGIVQHLFIGGSIGREGNGPNSYVASSTLFIHCDPGTVIASSPRPRYLQVGSGNFICSTITAKNLEVGEKLITAQLAASSQRGLVMQDDDNPTNSTVDWRYSDTEKVGGVLWVVASRSLTCTLLITQCHTDSDSRAEQQWR